MAVVPRDYAEDFPTNKWHDLARFGMKCLTVLAVVWFVASSFQNWQTGDYEKAKLGLKLAEIEKKGCRPNYGEPRS